MTFVFSLSFDPFSMTLSVRRDVSHFHNVQLVIIYFTYYAFSVASKTQHHTQYYLNFSTKLFSWIDFHWIIWSMFVARLSLIHYFAFTPLSVYYLHLERSGSHDGEWSNILNSRPSNIGCRHFNQCKTHTTLFISFKI